MGKADLIMANSYGENKVEVYLTIALIYWIVCLVSDRIIQLCEKRTYLSKIQKRRDVHAGRTKRLYQFKKRDMKSRFD